MADLLSVNVRTIWRLIAAGEFPQPIRLGRSSRVHVSRAAVHKRMNAGKLTAFMFYAPENNEDLPVYLRLFRKPSAPYLDIPSDECVAWAKEIAERGTTSLAVPGPDDDEPYGRTDLKPPKAIQQQSKRIEKAAKSKWRG